MLRTHEFGYHGITSDGRVTGLVNQPREVGGRKLVFAIMGNPRGVVALYELAHRREGTPNRPARPTAIIERSRRKRS